MTWGTEQRGRTKFNKRDLLEEEYRVTLSLYATLSSSLERSYFLRKKDESRQKANVKLTHILNSYDSPLLFSALQHPKIFITKKS